MTEETPAAKPSFFKKLKDWFTTAKESEAAEKTKDVAEKAWDKTKDVAEKTWDKTKDVAEDVKEWSGEKIEELRHKDDEGGEGGEAKPE